MSRRIRIAFIGVTATLAAVVCGGGWGPFSTSGWGPF